MRRALVLTFPLVGVAILAAASTSALAQPDPSGIQFVTIGNPNNPAYHGPDPFNQVTNRGSVPYEYRLSQTEITTGQWLEFMNAAMARPDIVQWVAPPSLWGAGIDVTYTGPGTRYRLGIQPDSASRPVYGITWRSAAVYCNWLCNGKSLTQAAFRSGAYDVNTFHSNPDRTFTDQESHTPGAQYWIPTLDEWIKGAHYDPTHAANDGWWLYANQKDRAPIYGPPVTFGGDGTGEANAGFHLSAFREYDIPLGSYPSQTSYYGLLDTAGAGGEWTEEILRSPLDGWYRRFGGSVASESPSGAAAGDIIYGFAADFPSSVSTNTSLRIASSIPTPSGLIVACAVVAVAIRRRSR